MALLTSFWLYDLLLTILTAVVALYVSFSIKYRYWSKRGVPLPFEPSFPMGNFKGISSTKSMAQIIKELYLRMKDEKYFGCFLLARPIFIPVDLELIKSILVKDFSSFHDRGINVNTDREPLAGHLFMMNGQEWRNMRIKLTPTFTTGKMRMMFQTLVDVGKELEKILEQSSNSEETEVKDILSRYTTDVISSCAFGIETNSLKNPKAEFRAMGNELTHPTWDQILKNLLLFIAPKHFQYLPITFFPKRLSDFFLGAVRDTMAYREENNVQRNDFLQLLLQLKTLGYIPDADNHAKNEDMKNIQKFTVEQAAAQAFLFFFAGFETSSSTMQFSLYELAINPDLQKQLQQEIDLSTKNGKDVSYETIMDIDLLDRVVSETLRKYPIAGFLLRECNTDYAISNSDLVLKNGDSLMIPIIGIHHNPEFYPNPEKFDPDRFLPEEKEKRQQYAYMPFGEGPRNCIGNRFALMQIKVGLVIFLARFSVSPSKKTPIPLVFDPKIDLLTPKGGMHLKITKR